MAAEPRWIKSEEVEQLHRHLVPSANLVDLGLLENAVDAARNTWAYDGVQDLLSLALRLMEALARGHPFSDGNKRAAFYAAVVFIERNGGVFAAPDTEEVAAWIEGMVERRLSVADLDRNLRPYVVLPPASPA